VADGGELSPEEVRRRAVSAGNPAAASQAVAAGAARSFLRVIERDLRRSAAVIERGTEIGEVVTVVAQR
jgi:hypothetical protein